MLFIWIQYLLFIPKWCLKSQPHLPGENKSIFCFRDKYLHASVYAIDIYGFAFPKSAHLFLIQFSRKAPIFQMPLGPRIPFSFFNLLWPSDAIWLHRTWSTLDQVMACCLVAPRHYLVQFWQIISEVLWHSLEGNLTANVLNFEMINLRLQSHFPGANELLSKLPAQVIPVLVAINNNWMHNSN